MPRDYYEVLGVERERRATRRSRGPSGASRASSIPTSTPTTPRRRRSSRRPPRPTRSSPTPSGGAPTTPSGTRACARAAGRPAAPGSARSRTSSRRSSGRRGDPFGFGGAAGRRAAATSRAAVEIALEDVAHRDRARGQLRRRRRLRALPRQRRRAGHADPHLRALRRRRPAAPGDQHARSVRWSARVACDACAGDGKIAETPCERVRRARRGPRASSAGRSTIPAGIEDGQRVRIGGAGHAGEPGGRPGDLYVEVAGRRGRALPSATATDLITRRRPPGHRGDARRHDQRRDPRGRAARSRSPPATQPGSEIGPARARPAAARRRAAWQTSAWSSTSSSRPTSPRSSGELAARLDETIEPENLEPEQRPRLLLARPPRVRLIRLAVRCRPAQAEPVLAELAVLAPNGVEEERRAGLRRIRDLRRRGRAAGPRLGRDGGRRGPGRGHRHRDPGRLGGPLAGLPQAAAGRRPALAAPLVGAGPRGAIDIVVDPGRAFGTGAHPTTRLCLELLSELARGGAAAGALTDLGTGSGVLAIAAAKLGWGPVAGLDSEPAALEAAAANAAANDVEIDLRRDNLREPARPGAHRGRQPDGAAPAGARRRLGRSAAAAADLLGPAR